MRAVNLLPADMRGAVETAAPVTAAPDDSGGLAAYLVLGVLALCVAATALLVLTGNQVDRNRADLAALQARDERVVTETARLKPYAELEQLANARVQTVRQLAGERFDWERGLRDLARALPADVSIKSLTGTLATDSGSGGNPLRGAVTAPAIELAGCTSGQRAVARMMARLRGVDGVTRVSLAKSDKPAASSAAPAAPAAGTDAVAAPSDGVGCARKGKQEPPDFQVVMFFERDAAATLAAGAAKPGAGASAAPTPAPTTGQSASPSASAKGSSE